MCFFAEEVSEEEMSDDDERENGNHVLLGKLCLVVGDTL